jgi:uncharacterized OsmC-like protein
VDFGDMGKIITDEPEPLGGSEGPNPSRLLATSVANCLAASLMFAIRKFKGDPGQVEAQVTGSLERVDGRWRVPSMSVTLQLGNSKDALPHIDRVLEQFEDFCVVTQSVRHGVDVSVAVFDSSGQKIHENA